MSKYLRALTALCTPSTTTTRRWLIALTATSWRFGIRAGMSLAASWPSWPAGCDTALKNGSRPRPSGMARIAMTTPRPFGLTDEMPFITSTAFQQQPLGAVLPRLCEFRPTAGPHGRRHDSSIRSTAFVTCPSNRYFRHERVLSFYLVMR